MSNRTCRFGLVILGEVVATCTLTENHSDDGRSALGNVIRFKGHSLVKADGTRITAPYVCGHCGRPCGDLAGGYAVVGGHRVCHPNAPDRPDCYVLITRYNEVIGVRLNETQLGFLTGRRA